MPKSPIEPVISVKYILLFLAVATGTAGAIIAIWAYTKFASPDSIGVSIKDLKDKPSTEEIKTLVAKMSNIIVLPKDELPSVLVVSDLTQMRNNPFFQDASVGDYILIYKHAGKVILYNPKSNRIVNMGPYSAGGEEASSSAKPLAPKLEATETPQAPQAPNPVSQ